MSSVMLSLNKWQRHDVQRIMHETRSRVEATRCRIILLLDQAKTVRQVEEMVGCVRSTVYMTLYRFEDAGTDGLRDQRLTRTPRKVTLEVRRKLLEYLDASPRDYGWRRSSWTRELFALQLEDDMNITLSQQHLGKVLREEKCRRGRARPVLRIPIQGRRQRLEEIRDIVEQADSDNEVLYVDEADIDLNPRIGFAWSRCGTQVQVPTPGKNIKYYLAGALNTRTGNVLYTHGPRKNSLLFISLLEHLNNTYQRTRCIHLILDNYIIHKSQRTIQALKELHGRLQLHFLPPYSPESNPMERLWKQLHDNVTRNHRQPDMPSLWNDVVCFMEDVQPFPGTKVSTLKRVV